MGEDGQLLPVGQDHGVPEEVGVLHRNPVVGQGHRPGGLEGLKVVDLLALLALGHGGDGEDLGAPRLGGFLLDEDHALGDVDDGPGVGHTGDGGEAARGGGPGAGGDGLFVFKAGLPEVDVHVHKPGADGEALGVNDLGAGRAQVASDDGHLAVLDEDVQHPADAADGIHQTALANEQFHTASLPFPGEFSK